MQVSGQRHAPAALPLTKTRYPLYRRLGGPQGRSGRVRKISPPPGFDIRTIQPVASRYTDWDKPVRFSQAIFIYCKWVYTRWQRRVGLYRYTRQLYTYTYINKRRNSMQNVTQNRKRRNGTRKQENKHTKNTKKRNSVNNKITNSNK